MPSGNCWNLPEFIANSGNVDMLQEIMKLNVDINWENCVIASILQPQNYQMQKELMKHNSSMDTKQKENFYQKIEVLKNKNNISLNYMRYNLQNYKSSLYADVEFIKNKMKTN